MTWSIILDSAGMLLIGVAIGSQFSEPTTSEERVVNFFNAAEGPHKYIVKSSDECEISVEPDDEDAFGSWTTRVFSRVWFRSPVLGRDLISRLETFQLTTYAHDQGFCDDPAAGVWSWFDVAIFESISAERPRVKDGRALIWKSHENNICTRTPEKKDGIVFDKDHEMFSLLEEGNVIVVMISARFRGWKNHAQKGHFILGVAATAVRRNPHTLGVDYHQLQEARARWMQLYDVYLQLLTPRDLPPAYSDLVASATQPWRADDPLGFNKPPLRLLALDGGGVRGISTLHILWKIMKEATGDERARPCDYFDMIAGTSTGGLIAIMLGRLGMNIPDCIEVYEKLSKTIFGGHWMTTGLSLVRTGAYHDAEVFVSALEEFLVNEGWDKDMLLHNPDSGACKVFVLSCQANNVNNELATHIRSYVNPHVTLYTGVGAKILEAARATAAAPAYFRQQTIGAENQVDGGLFANNPIFCLINEAESFFGPARRKQCVVSLGTGMQPNVAFSDGVYKDLGLNTKWLPIATSQEREHLLAEQDSRVHGAYWRFNVGKRTRDGKDWEMPIALDDWQGMKTFVEWTETYLDDPEQVAKVAACAAKLKN